jgi:ABC-type Na+ transport system ATPase subunit NatA
MKLFFSRIKDFRTAQDLYEKGLGIPKRGVLFLCDDGESFHLYLIKNFEVMPIIRNVLVLNEHELYRHPKDAGIKGSHDVGRFLVILKDENDYVEILNVVGKANFFSALKSLHEYSYLNNEAPERNLLKRFEKNEILRTNLRRNRQLQYLSEQGYERFVSEFFKKDLVSDAEKINVVIPLKGNGSLHLEVDFFKSGVVESNAIALIGKNGVGKTQALKVIKSNVLNGRSYKKILDVNLVKTISRTNGSDLASFTMDSIGKVNFQSALKSLFERKKKYQYFNRASIIKDLLHEDFNCNDLVLTLIDGSEISIWSKSMRANLVDLEVAPKFMRYGAEFKLSQGQSFVFSMILILLLHIEQYSIVLIDEPETYLHPNLIVSFHRILQYILKKTKSKAVLSTHSIFLIRELPKESVIIITSQAGTPFVRLPFRETFGASLDRLADEVFYDDEATLKVREYVEQFREKYPKATFKDVKHLSADLATRILAYD